MSLSATLFGRDSAIFQATNILGLGIPGWLDRKFGAPDTEGPRLSDLSIQTGTYGAQIPRLYGTVAVMGNVIWLENNKLKETVRKNKSGGKGGGGASKPTKTYSYSATFHLALCEGPIAGVRRIWCSDKLIYNAGSDDLQTIISSNKAAKGWKLYLGADDQMPDSRYQANVGVANASAHRGMPYIAFYDFQLADYSNSLQGSQFKVEVVTASTSSVSAKKKTLSSSMTGWTGLAFDGNTFCAVADESAISISTTSGDTWANNAMPSGRWMDVAFNGSVLCAVGLFTGSQAARVAISKNGGRSWDNIAVSALAFGANSVLGADGKFLAIRGGGVTDVVVSADNGVTWTLGAMPARDNWKDSAWNGTIFCAVGNLASKSATSSDGLTWQEHQMPAFAWDSITNAGSTFCSVSNGSDKSAVSTDGINWTLGTLPISGSWNEIEHNGEYFCAMQRASTNAIFATSVDGLIWNSHSLPAVSNIGGLTAFPGGFMAIDRLTNDFYIITTPAVNSAVTLSSIVTSEIALSALIGSSDIDSILLNSNVRGYRVTGGSIRSAIEPLQAAFPFDVRQRGYKIQFVPRGQSSVVTIPWEQLGATSGSKASDIFQQSREMDAQLPARTTVKYLDAEREYGISEQYSERLNTEAINKVDRELALVLTANEAAGVAEMLNFLPWMERTESVFTLPPTYRNLEPGDVVTVTLPTATHELRTTEIIETQDGRIECKALPNRAALYTPNATGGEGVPPAGTIGLGGASLFVPLDIPVVDDAIQNTIGFVGVMTGYTDGWPGALAVRSNDGGQTWSDVQAYSGKASIGYATGVLPSSSCTLIDQRILIVGMISGTPESITRDQMLSGMNYAAYGVDGRWEIVRFQNATLQADGGYLLSSFVRGEKGTEWATGIHVAGDYFILLDDPDNAFIGSSTESILSPRLYRGITSGDTLDDATDVAFTYRGVNLECLSPVYAQGTRDGSSNFTGTFTRRSRLSNSWWANGVVAPVGETTESYEIDVMNGSTVVRTITSSTPSFSYSAANQTTDFGSAQSSITFRLYQLSATVGRGYPLEVTL